MEKINIMKSTILIVDDTETNIDILLDLMADEYDLLVALDGRSALEIVKSDKIDLILLDIMMPEMDGYEVCQVLKRDEKTKDIPVIFITAKTDEDSIEKAYSVGGLDYVSKPFKPRELQARIKTQLHVKTLMENLEFIASFDSMTGVYNRRKFFSLAKKRFEESQENLYAVMIDIDKFKKVNDTYGHSVGDDVIKIVAQTIKENLLPETIFGRIGGEEFALLCTRDSKEEVHQNIELVRKKIEDLEVITEDKEIVKFTISEGIAACIADTQSLDKLLKEADIALYEAKGSGRNKVIFR